jgi:hypothetical protein
MQMAEPSSIPCFFCTYLTNVFTHLVDNIIVKCVDYMDGLAYNLLVVVQVDMVR